MKKWILRVGIGLAVVPLVYLGVAFGLVLFSSTAVPDPKKDNLKFDDLKTTSDDKLPEKRSYTARDGQDLTYRYYSAHDQKRSNTVLILMHGSGYHHQYLGPLAMALANEHHVDVYTPDMRGHGQNAQQPGDVEYVGQLEDDLQDFLHTVKDKNPKARIILGGHSSGGGLVIRYAGGQSQDLVDAYLLLAPYIHHNAPTNASTNSEWANPNVPRMIGLSMLERFNITALHHLPVISFNMPGDLRDGSETLTYSYRLHYSMVPRDDYGRDLSQIQEPTLVMAGSEDRSFNAEAYAPLFKQYTAADVRILEGLSHFGLVTERESYLQIAEWIRE